VLLGRLALPEAPTTVAAADARRVHVEDSLVAVPYIPAGRIADLGSGAGVPGLVLAAALPDRSFVLVEAVGRKCAFIRETAAAMGLANVEVLHARAEEVPPAFDGVCARALASLPVLCEYAAPLLAEGGRAVFWKGAVAPQEEADGRHAASVLGLGEPSVVPVTPFAGSARRTLWVFEKVAATPERFPRRAGMATKRPLAAPSS
jgi:16S rRNA (guanine527-N7)-methyltransferase